MVVERFVNRPQWLECLPVEWQELARHEQRLIEEKRASELELFYLSSTTYLVIDPRSGRSSIKIGE